MTTKQRYEAEVTAWVDQAIGHRDLLVDLVQSFHPAAKLRVKTDLKITARNTQAACDAVAAEIKRTATVDPVEQLKTALAQRDMPTIWSVLQSAWFGVPESRGCWEIPGFSEAVELLETYPYEG